VIAAKGAFGQDLAAIVRQRFSTCVVVIDTGGGDRNLLDQRCTGVGTYTDHEAMYGPLSLVLYPACVAVSLAGGRNDGRVDQRAGLHCHCLRLELHGQSFKQRPVKLVRTQQLTKSDKSGTLRRRFSYPKPVEATKGCSIV